MSAALDISGACHYVRGLITSGPVHLAFQRLSTRLHDEGLLPVPGTSRWWQLNDHEIQVQCHVEKVSEQ